MKVIEYIKEHGLQKLVDEFHIEVKDYSDRVVLNYNQIESPRFNPIVDECRALILRKNTWEVMARSFNRFYNLNEQPNSSFNFHNSLVLEKLDGSLISVYFDGQEWCVASRSMAYAEGTIPLGITFRDLFDKASANTSLWKFLNNDEYKDKTWVFELCSPFNRVVTNYTDTTIALIGARYNSGKEVGNKELDGYALLMGVKRPKYYKFTTLEETLGYLKELNALDEGFVCVNEGDVFQRVKVKNPRYLEIHHLRNNGVISAKRVFALVVMNEQKELLSYFPEDKPYFDFVEGIWKEFIDKTQEVYDKYGKIENQKEFAISIMGCDEVSDVMKGILFQMRKMRKNGLMEIIKGLDTHGIHRLAKGLGVKEKMAKKFMIVMDKED